MPAQGKDLHGEKKEKHNEACHAGTPLHFTLTGGDIDMVTAGYHVDMLTSCQCTQIALDLCVRRQINKNAYMTRIRAKSYSETEEESLDD